MCGRETSNGAIGCDSCPLWYHSTTACTGLQPATLRCIQDEGGDAVRFVCVNCRCNPQPGDTTVSPDAMSQLFSMVKALATCVTELTKEVSALKCINARVQSGQHQQTQGSLSQSLIRDEVREEVREHAERNKRKDSLFVRGISAQNNNAFVEVFKEVCHATTGQVIAPDTVFCIDRPKKLYRVKIANAEDRQKVLDTAKDLKDHSRYADVFINRDLTFKQRQQRRLRVRADAAGASQVSADAAGASQDENNPVAPGAPSPLPGRRLRSSSVTVMGNTTAPQGASGVNFQ